MANDTNTNLRGQMIYSIFPRNYTQTGNFKTIEADLPRIKRLGTDIIWLMPIYPIGQKNRKGQLGSPYAIADYRGINPELGTMADFISLSKAIHQQGMQLMIDVVYNHTSPDSKLLAAHPEWFYHRPDGQLGNRVADWSDIIDLDYSQPELWDYQIETLKQWADYVDGFRCDVAPLVPLQFWLKARKALADYKPGLTWLAESNDPTFIKQVRDSGFDDLSDGELYQAFDLVYDYDVLDDLHATVAGLQSLGEFARILMRQDVTFPKNYVKMRFLENHDVPRAADYIPNEQLPNLQAFSLFEKGASLIYAGQEFGQAHLPSLFDADPVELTGPTDLSPVIQRVMSLKHARQALFSQGAYQVSAVNEDVLCIKYQWQGQTAQGYFACHHFQGKVACDLPDNQYTNQLNGELVYVKNQQLTLANYPVIIFN